MLLGTIILNRFVTTNMTVHESHTAAGLQDIAKARGYFDDAIDVCRKMFPASEELLAESFYYAGNAAFIQSELADAQDYFKPALPLYRNSR